MRKYPTLPALDGDDLLAILAASQVFHASSDMERISRTVVDYVSEFFSLQMALVCLWQENDSQLSMAASAPDDCAGDARALCVQYHDALRTMMLQQKTLPPHCIPLDPSYQLFAVPLLDSDALAPIGVLVLRMQPQKVFAEHEHRLLEGIVFQAALALDNARLYQQVRAGREQLQAILDSTHEAIFLLDVRGRLWRFNPLAEALLGQNLTPYLGQSFLHWVHEVGREHLERRTGLTLQGIRTYIRAVRDYPAQMRQRRFAQLGMGEARATRYIDETGSPVLDPQGKLVGWLIVWRDSTEERNLERMRQELSSMIVHDLRNPINSITSSLSMLHDLIHEDENDKALLLEVVSIAHSSADYMFNLVQSILDVSRLEENSLVLECESMALADCIDYAAQSIYSQTVAAKIHLTTDVSGDLPPVWIDDEKIRRVMVNLLDNAVRHTPQGGAVHVTVCFDAERDKVLTCIADTGPGIPVEARSRIFDKFFQLDQQAVHGHKGTGLGLTFCKLAIEAHGGDIWVEDANTGGALFCFTLPLAPSGTEMPEID